MTYLPRVEFFREPILDDYLEEDHPIGAVAIKYKVSIEDIFDILFYKKVSTPSYLEKRVQDYIDKSKSMNKLSQKINCSRKLLHTICLRLKNEENRKKYKRFIRMIKLEEDLPLFIKNMDILLDEIKNDRANKICVEETCKRLGIGNRKYYNIVHKYNIPTKDVFFREEKYADEIKKDRENGISSRETVERIGGTFYGYYKVIHQKKMPMSKQLCY
jgi:hypothetical protein